MSRQDDLKKLIINHQRRLQKLQEQQALFGAYTPPHITIEIEDTESELEQLQTELVDLAEGTSVVELVPSEPVNLSSRVQVFISYSRQDIDFVHRLAADLERAGVSTWWDVSNLVGGDDWSQTIESALKESQYCLVVLSPQSVESKWVRKEYLYAMRLEIKIIPLAYRNCEPPLALNDLQQLDFQGSHYELGLEQLLVLLSVDSSRIAESATILPTATQSLKPGKRPLASLNNTRWPIIGGAITLFVLVWTLYYASGTGLLSFSSGAAPSEHVVIAPTATLFIPVETPVSIATSTEAATILPLPTDTLVSSTDTPTPSPSPLPPTPTITSTPTPTLLPALITDSQGVPMVLVPAGPFEMGQRSKYTESSFVHTVTLDAFYIDQYEVTNARYAACVDVGVCSPPSTNKSLTLESYYGNPEYDNFPVINIIWGQAQAYCEWRGARLPTEAEWEKAARGTDERSYPWGEEIDCERANYGGDGFGICVGETTPVGQYANGVSPYGVYDMVGNVWEWVADWYDPDYYIKSPHQDPQGPDSGNEKILRGGSWFEAALPELDNYTIIRHHTDPASTQFYIGFRCARSL